MPRKPEQPRKKQPGTAGISLPRPCDASGGFYGDAWRRGAFSYETGIFDFTAFNGKSGQGLYEKQHLRVRLERGIFGRRQRGQRTYQQYPAENSENQAGRKLHSDGLGNRIQNEIKTLRFLYTFPKVSKIRAVMINIGSGKREQIPRKNTSRSGRHV